MNRFERIMKQYFKNGEFNFGNLSDIKINNNDLITFRKLTDAYRINDFDATETTKRILKSICSLLDSNQSLEAQKNPLETLQNTIISSFINKTEEYLITLLAQASKESFEDILQNELDEETKAKFLWRY